MNIRQVTVVALICTLMFGCGGGDDDGGSKGGGISLGGGDGGTGGETPGGGGIPGGGGGTGGGGNAQAEIQGSWSSPCIALEDGSTAVQIYTFGQTDDGTKLFSETYGFFNTGNCSGDAGSFSLLGPITYSGSQSTSTCVAEKFSATYVMAVVDGTTMSDQKFSETKYYNQTVSSMACVYKGSLLLGDGSGGMNAGQAYTPYKSKILSDSKRLKKNISDESIDLSTLKKVEELRKLLK